MKRRLSPVISAEAQEIGNNIYAMYGLKITEADGRCGFGHFVFFSMHRLLS